MGAGQLLAEHLQNQAKWREIKAEEYPDDDRNMRASNALAAAAEAVETLPDDDPRLQKMVKAGWFDNGGFDPWAPGQEVVRRYGFHRGNTSASDLLDDLAAAAEPELLDI